jgi:hypothetical protein
MTIRLGLQISNFSCGTDVEQLFPSVVAQAREAESAGFDSVFVMDHFYQPPTVSSPEQPMLKVYTALGALATATERVQLGALVTGNTYRNPTLLAKVITTESAIAKPRYRDRIPDQIPLEMRERMLVGLHTGIITTAAEALRPLVGR